MRQLLAELAGRAVPVERGAFGPARAWPTWLFKRRCSAIGARDRRRQQERRLLALQQVLALPEQCGASSASTSASTQGEAAVASCVVYQENAMKKATRRFNIRRRRAGDDSPPCVRSSAGVTSTWAAGEGMAPDLILIDSGEGRVACAQAALANSGSGNWR